MLRRFVDVKESEKGAVLWAFAYFFAILCGYYLLRPLRDEMGIRGGVTQIKWMVTATFAVMLLAVPAFSAVVARVPRRRIIPVVYRSCAAMLVGFLVAERAGAPGAVLARVFFVWVSVFNLMVVSVFWSFLVDVFRSDQGKRLFGFVAAGGSAGAIAGPWIAGRLASTFGPASLWLAAAALLEAAVWCVRRLSRWAETNRSVGFAESAERPIGGGVWAGFRQSLASPYLLGISGLLLCYSATSTVAYQDQAGIVSASIRDSASRTALFANVDLAVNAVALVLQGVVAGRLLARGGLVIALAVLPVVTGAGYLALIASPGLATLIGFQVIRRAAQYGLERPAREVLFTVVEPEAKYKAKNFIDTVVFRGGDALSVWAYTGARGAGLPAAAGWGMAAALSLAWLAGAVAMGRRQNTLARAQEAARDRKEVA
ncbi:MAG: MFS transporter [Acidobacteriia bacterium]|nr:MFS transporter [Terriglobia bacterium]